MEIRLARAEIERFGEKVMLMVMLLAAVLLGLIV